MASKIGRSDNRGGVAAATRIGSGGVGDGQRWGWGCEVAVTGMGIGDNGDE